MAACKTLVRTSLSCLQCTPRATNLPPLSSQRLHPISSPSPLLRFPRNRGFRLEPAGAPSRPYAAVSLAENLIPEPAEDSAEDNVEELLLKRDDVSGFMKMERRPEVRNESTRPGRWFPYLDQFRAGSTVLSSDEVLEAVDPLISEVRKERFRNVVKNRSYSVCLVVEGLADLGNVSATFRSADALGFQSVHVVSCNSSKRYRENRLVSVGAEKWLDIELWDSARECFEVLKSRGYRIATTHVGIDAVSIYDMDWSCPTAIVVGNEGRGISDEALELSDLHCSIPMKGMVDSFNVSVAAGILMHHAVCDRTSRMGGHCDLTLEERQILLAEFSLRHSKSAIDIAKEFGKRKVSSPIQSFD
ncbi:hypothetical protein RJ639_020351 [Escallonia herrerae]|uniref:tRNA/rRNA methyltransferase SpoU type domain-containing protein n=1 Tax=Escallonia herrerae TaxID=1293975 RepID=A0AA88V4U3_9ASTE|nr:hypothetical protein RJ639_020351 [Escallonia herrerae]